jgi:hypothetical protein
MVIDGMDRAIMRQSGKTRTTGRLFRLDLAVTVPTPHPTGLANESD